jgi:cytochrome c-type protein NapB
MTSRKETIMRSKAQNSIRLVAAVAPLLLLGAGSADDMKEANDGLELYFRGADLLALADQSLPVYPDMKTGESIKLQRDFPDAPPQIPHTVEDMYPITTDENECLDCHHPENTLSKDDAPLPESHFRAPVMGKGGAGNPMIWVVKDYKVRDRVGERYDCSMCHTPQASNVKTPNNRFISTRRTK